MNRLSIAKQAIILRSFVEGVSIRGAARIHGVSKCTTLRLLKDAGAFATVVHRQLVQRIWPDQVQVDEIWGFVGKKLRNIDSKNRGAYWTFIALDVRSKLVITYLTGARSPANARLFLRDLKARTVGRFQLTTDGCSIYRGAVDEVLGDSVDHGMIVKTYDKTSRHVDAPPMFTGFVKQKLSGNPRFANITTNHIEVFNGTLRRSNHRLSRRTRGHSKTLANHEAALGLTFFYYNFCRPHRTLTKAHNRRYRVTPAMAAGLTDVPWTLDWLCRGLRDDLDIENAQQWTRAHLA